ncbi:MAG: metal-sulfur cluster assembly factor [Egibacteraceae bacterium]
MSTMVTTGQVMEALGEVIDPDLGINVVDLGFVYGVEVAEDGTATLDMTLTSPACPLTKVIEDQIRTALIGAGLVPNFRVNWVFTPVWTPARITADGRDQLQAIGFSL